MRSRERSQRGRRVGGYIGFFGLQEWYARLLPEQQKLLRQACPDIDSGSLSYTSQTAGQFLSSCAREVAPHDPGFAEQLHQRALQIEHDPIHRHYVLMEIADFYKDCALDPARWFEVIQEDLSLLPAFARAWKKKEKTSLPSYPALDEMIRVLRNRGDLPEALSLCKRAREMNVAGDWNTRIEDLKSRMR